ncbi:MAG: UDP-N-acetylmuramate--L-alanine ligase [Candidatus Omnitrophica bacterium]|nr:UDP-N-acetylmuramate--L-alanine ligase [Candidatus Omnitrophota bacterium]
MEKILSKVKKVHLVGIGGIGMSGLAILLKEKGFAVSGSDVKTNHTIDGLILKDISVCLGHSSENLKDVDLFCYSSAIKEDNCEYQAAIQLKIPIVRRAQLLAYLSQEQNTIAISGSHGKTTTTSLLGFVMEELNYNPTVFVGGIPLNDCQHARWGDGPFVIEADESDGSLLCYEPKVSIITNIDYEHLDYYRDISHIKETFSLFARNTKNLVIGCGDDTRVVEVLERVKSLSYGLASTNDLYAKNIKGAPGGTYFDLVVKDNQYPVFVPLLGEHNVLNCLAVLSYFYYLGEDLKKVITALSGFKGTKRRLQVKGQINGVTFIDDYAHHPTEIKAVLKSLRALNPSRLIAIFEPHRFSRVKALYEEFLNCFDLADKVVFTDIYAASEKEISGINSEIFSSDVKKKSPAEVSYFSKKVLTQELLSSFCGGDIVVGLGAGDISNLMETLVDEFSKNGFESKSRLK